MSSKSNRLANGEFGFLVTNVAGWLDTGIVIAGARAGGIAVLNFESIADLPAAVEALNRVARMARPSFGVKLEAGSPLSAEMLNRLPAKVNLVILTPGDEDRLGILVNAARQRSLSVWLEVTSSEQAALAKKLKADALIAKGHEAGGAVGEETVFVLLQRLLSEFSLPVWAHGGAGRHSVAASYVAGAAGVVLDSQLLLTPESSLPVKARTAVERMEGDETLCLGLELGELYRVYRRPGMVSVDRLQQMERELAAGEASDDARRRWREALVAGVNWEDPEKFFWPLGQDAALAEPLARRYRTVSGIVRGLRSALDEHVELAKLHRPLDASAPLAQAHGTLFPILQGPMTRVSDTASFATAIVEGGGLPFLALALLRAAQVEKLLAETKERMGDRPWGIGILGFVPSELRVEQLEVVRQFRPPFAIIAGGRPDQAAGLEANGTACYLHVPAPALLRLFLQDGARRFIFEGRECGGHVGPRTSFVLWDAMLDVLLEAIDGGVRAEDLHVVFAGGIHDRRSAAMVAAMAGLLAARGAKIGVLMGTAYLFTREAVGSGAIVEGFQQEALRCQRTVLLESGPGHATRCAETPFFETFRSERRKLLSQKGPGESVRESLEELNLGRLRIASKGITRTASGSSDEGRYTQVDSEQQRVEGMYMIGQVAALRDRVCTIRELHEEVSRGGAEVLQETPSLVERLERSGSEPPCDIAIIGMACVLPKAPNVRVFWSNLLNKVDAISEVPRERFNIDLYYSPDRKARDKIYSKWGGFLDDVPFDPMRYGIPPAALASIDPMQLLSLVVVDEALRDSGYGDREFHRLKTSVIFGASGGLGDLGGNYAVRSWLAQHFAQVPEELLARLPEWTEDSFPGLLPNVVAGRIANRFDLGGVNFTVDAACASSLAAAYAGVRELTAGASDMVIVGGVETVQNPFCFLCFAKSQALSPTGRCRPFDESADGIAISEGVSVLVMKRLADAERDGDRVYAVIRAIGGSSDGRGRSMTAPRPEGQKLVLRRAYEQAGFSPSTIGLVEAHGTGTVAGDTAELSSLSDIMRDSNAAPHSCAIGSVKSMVGHTKSAAGITGLMKVALALYHKVLPPTLHVERPNAKLREAGSPLFANTEPLPWMPPASTPRRAGVSSFGFGGTNFHAVLEEYSEDLRDVADRPTVEQWPAELFLWNALSPASLSASLDSLARELDAGARPELRDLAASLCRRVGEPREGGMRLAVVASSLEDLQKKIARAQEALTAGRALDDPSGVYLASVAPRGQVAFLFPGQGSQRPAMLSELALHFSEFRQSFEEAERVLSGRLSQKLSAYVYPPPAFTPEEEKHHMDALTDTAVAQPALGAVEMALARLLKRLGVKPDMLAGHSYGEYVALCAAGCLSTEALFDLSEARGRAIKESVQDEPGAMAAVVADADAVSAALQDLTAVTIANYNSSKQTVIAGDREAVQKAIDRLQATGLSAKLLPVACAFHSTLMQPARDRLAAVLARQSFSQPKTKVFSNTLGGIYPDDPGAIGQLLADHLVQPVRFADEIRSMYEQGARVFVEVGPKGVLTGLARQTLAGLDATCIQLDAGERGGLVHLLHALAQLAVRGALADADQLFRGRSGPVQEAARRGAAEQPQPAWLVNGGHAFPRSQRPKIYEPLKLVTEDWAGASGQDRQAQVAPSDTLAPATPRLELRPPNGDRVALTAAAKPVVPAASTPTPAYHVQPAAPVVTAAQAGQGNLDAVMLPFQQLMSQFLQTQAAIMTAYLQTVPGSGAANGEAPRAALPPLQTEALVAAYLSPVSAPAPAIAVPAAVQPVAPSLPPATLAAAAADPAALSTAPQAIQVASKGADTQRDVAGELVKIVSERTGYPAEMLELDAAIEADLGIDSIKRVEILSSFQHLCTASEQAALQGGMEKLTSAVTLREVADRISAVIGGADPVRSPSGQAVTLPRCRAVTVEKKRQGKQQFFPGRVTLITDDETGIAAGLAEALKRGGEQVVLLRHIPDAVLSANGVQSTDLTDPAAVEQLVGKIRLQYGPIGALIHLLPMRAEGPVSSKTTLSEWHKHLRLDIGSFFAVVRSAQGDLKQTGRAGGALVAAVTGRGGMLGLSGGGALAPTHHGIADFCKTVALELPEALCKIIDLDASDPLMVLQQKLVDELTTPDETLQVGLPGDRRLVPLMEIAPLDLKARCPIDRDWVVLLTGGARGITAEIAKLLAERCQPTLILAGISPYPSGEESAETAQITDALRLKSVLAAKLSATERVVKPADVEAAAQRLFKDREIRSTVEALQRKGSRVEYHALDMRDEVAFGDLIDAIYERYGRLDAVVHGAGIIEDKLIQDKTPESFDRVFYTKADSVFVLARKLRPDSLKCVLLMSSVTAAFGNRGQADYGAANGILNGLAVELSAGWPAHVVAVNWGPWDSAAAGSGRSGMVSEQVRQQFLARGVQPISPAAGALAALDEIECGTALESAVVVGDGPWVKQALPPSPARTAVAAAGSRA